MERGRWIWYPGDMELYHALLQNFDRVERGYGWPAYWKSEGFRGRVYFRREFDLEGETTFCVDSGAVGHVLVREVAVDESRRVLSERKYPFGQRISAGPGRIEVTVHAGRIDAFPAVLVSGEEIFSDEQWLACDYAGDPCPAGVSSLFTSRDDDPLRVPLSEAEVRPSRVEEAVSVQGTAGFLYTFSEEIYGVIGVGKKTEESGDREGMEESGEREREDMAAMSAAELPVVYCGESAAEALDEECCYIRFSPDPATGECPAAAFACVFVPGPRRELLARRQWVDLPVRAAFVCDDERLSRIWAVSEHTFRLCSGMFFIDGIKRDRWIWSGDAYQSLFVNRYLLADPEIEERTLLALRGNDPVTGHINTITDYSMLWVIAVWEHQISFGRTAFLRQIYPKMVSLMDFVLSQRQEDGFFVGRPGDWIYIDWAGLDKEGVFGAEQMVLAGALEAMACCAGVLGREQEQAGYEECREELIRAVRERFWDAEKGAFIDSYVSGRRQVSRQTNLFALRFGVADEGQSEEIRRNVLDNPAVPAITTPYFNFYALDACGELGDRETLLRTLRDYWGGMLDRGATTFWEAFDPDCPESEQYDMYGDHFGKSLCHAWSASPVYLIARYLLGLRPDGQVQPQLDSFSHVEAVLPLGEERAVHIDRREGETRVAWMSAAEAAPLVERIRQENRAQGEN